MSAVTLVQIVSEEPLANLLGALALEPAKIVFLHTPKNAARAGWTRLALEKAGLRFEHTFHQLSEQPSLQETAAAIRARAETSPDGSSPVVNFTGDSAPIVIGAFVDAYSRKIPSFHVDGERLRFVDGGTGPAPSLLANGGAAAAVRARARLGIDVLAVAQGFESVSAGLDPEPLLPLARHMLHHLDEETAISQALLALPDPRHPEEVPSFLETPVFENAISDEAARLAIEGGVLERRDGELFFARPASLSRLEEWVESGEYSRPEWFEALAPLQNAVNFFGGGWWELSVFDAARCSGLFRDLRWSASATLAGQTYEKDILGLQEHALAIFSCKRGGGGGRHLVAGLDELDANARHFGGNLARRYLCVSQPIPPAPFRVLQERAAQTRTVLVGPAEKLSADSFLRPPPRISPP